MAEFKSTPQYIDLGYNPQIVSYNITLEDVQDVDDLIFDLKVKVNDNEYKLAKDNIYPGRLDGNDDTVYSNFFDIKTLVGNNLGYDFEPSTTAPDPSTSHCARVTYETDDLVKSLLYFSGITEYIGFTPTGTYFVGGEINFVNTGDNFKIPQGSTINVVQTSGLYPANSGVKTLPQFTVGTPNDLIVINDVIYTSDPGSILPYPYIDPNATGYIESASNPDVPLSGGNYAINASMDRNEYINYDHNDYMMTGTTGDKKILSNFQEFDIHHDEELTINILNIKSEFSTIYVTRFDENDNIIGVETVLSQNFFIGTEDYREGVITLPIGANVVGNVVDLTDTAYYKINLKNTNNDIINSEIRVNLTCKDRYDVVRFAYLNTLGGFDYINFTKKHYKQNTVNRNIYTKRLGLYTPDNNYSYDWGYNSSYVEDTVYNMQNDIEYKCYSNWLDQRQSDMVNELLKSSTTFVKIGDNDWVGVIITDSEIEEKQKINGDLMAYEINFRLTYTNNRQTS
jgi:hypothetical protein